MAFADIALTFRSNKFAVLMKTSVGKALSRAIRTSLFLWAGANGVSPDRHLK